MTYDPSHPPAAQPYPLRPTVTISAGTAVKIGFFAAFGALLFSIVVSLVSIVLLLVLGVSFSGVLHNS